MYIATTYKEYIYLAGPLPIIPPQPICTCNASRSACVHVPVNVMLCQLPEVEKLKDCADCQAPPMYIFPYMNPGAPGTNP